ncbi:MAG TPA: bifunctional (p)ppGpp synthetase/guanosine-3',5'-bis(diphosphate) 3'-pyrophosphohydrolase, partial [Acidobacteria bacterium]|nr:bifunctional (p)ppGpp synthetase/guanosine-3',5'-bis(diphosphate) 3'-pyrophosphohydrolase [Acidobacteriota bacterium]
MIRFEDIQERMEQYRPTADTELLRRAYIFSAMVHRGQSRYSGEPYLIHPLAVAYILADLELDEATVATGLLHDTIEDSADPRATAEELQQRFGQSIYHLVDGVTKLKKLEFATDADRQAANLRKMILAMVDDVRVVLVKLADRLHNMRTLGHLPAHKQQRIAGETLQIYVPLANRLGLGQIKSELEDLSLRFGEPEVYEELHAHLA